MKKFAALFSFLFLSSYMLLAQDVVGNDSKKAILKPASDFIMMEFAYNGWTNKPDSIRVSGLGRGFNAFLCYDFPIKNSNMSFAAGIGVNSNNIYLDNQRIITTDTGGAAVARFVDTSGQKKYKLSTTYITAPFEIRYFGNSDNRNKGFKAAIGLRVGLLAGAHTKEVISVAGTNIIEKENTTRYMNTWNFTATVRIGWGNFYMMGSYNLNTLYKENSGPQMVPYSIGIGVTGL
jgi:hypothetical protein